MLFQSTDKYFLLKHWFGTLLMGPVFLMLLSLGVDPGWTIKEIFQLFPWFLFFGFIFSMPALVIYYFIYLLLNQFNVQPDLQKWVLIAVAIIGVVLTNLILKGSLAPYNATAYSLAAFFTGLICRLGNRKLQFSENDLSL